MAKLFDAVQRFRKIEEVCSSADVLPPVYLMDEVVEQAKESVDSAQSVSEHISRNLGNRNPVVKWKALKLTRHLCSKGCVQFQRCMQRHASAIRELVHYKGDPDPFKGEANNQRVRELAKEVLDLLYAQMNQPASSNPALQGRIQGFGSSMPSGTAGGGGGGGSGASGTFTSVPNTRMMAFGSNSQGPMPPGDSTRGGGGFTGGGTQAGSGFMGNSQTFGGGGHNRNGSLGEPVLGSRSSAVQGSGGGAYGASGGSFGPSGGGGGTFGSGGGGGTFGPVGGTLGLASGGSNRNLGGAGGGFDSSGRATAGIGGSGPEASLLGGEAALVDSMCTSGGLRAQPSAADLKQFVQSVSASDGLKVAELMMKKLGSDQWQVVLRTLYALEAVLDQGMTQACGEVAVMFQSDPTPVYAATSATQPQVRTQAAKCIKLLTGEDVDIGTATGSKVVPAPSGAAATQKQAPPAPPAVDLLGDLFQSASEPMPAPAAPAPAPAAAPAAAAPVTAQDDPFAVLAALHPPPAAAAAVPKPAAPAAAAAGGRPALDDLFASMGVSAPGSAPQQPSVMQTQLGVGGYGVTGGMAPNGFPAAGLSGMTGQPGMSMPGAGHPGMAGQPGMVGGVYPGMGMQPGGMQPGGMQAGGMQPGGMQPGGMPGGMHPGGVQPGGGMQGGWGLPQQPGFGGQAPQPSAPYGAGGMGQMPGPGGFSGAPGGMGMGQMPGHGGFASYGAPGMQSGGMGGQGSGSWSMPSGHGMPGGGGGLPYTQTAGSGAAAQGGAKGNAQDSAFDFVKSAFK